jgi:glyoxylase-like metal-dependent hydrolase (beta-lactamase superfamily II)
MNLHIIDTGFFKLDGGAMFGVVPKSIWNKTNPADENNMCTWAMRCLLIEDGNRLILIDTGIGDKQDAKFFGFFYLHGEDTLIKSIQKAGFSPDQITDVILTHLHFDHCGGAIRYNNDKSKAEPTFKNATYWSNEDHWSWAVHPNPREKASFLKENIFPIQESGQLKFITPNSIPFSNLEILFVDGHTEKQMLPLVKYKNKTIAFAADLLPSSSHIPLPYIMAYDTRPLLSMKEKELFLNRAVAEEFILFLEHDPIVACCTVQNTDRGIKLKDTLQFHEIL